MNSKSSRTEGFLKFFLFSNCCSFSTESFDACSFMFWSPFKGKLDSGPRYSAPDQPKISEQQTDPPEKASQGTSPREFSAQQ